MLGRRAGIVMVWLRGTKKRERKGVQGGICVEDGTIDGRELGKRGYESGGLPSCLPVLLEAWIN